MSYNNSVMFYTFCCQFILQIIFNFGVLRNCLKLFVAVFYHLLNWLKTTYVWRAKLKAETKKLKKDLQSGNHKSKNKSSVDNTSEAAGNDQLLWKFHFDFLGCCLGGVYF